MPSGVATQRRSLIALSEIDQTFNNSVIKELADILKIQDDAYSRLAHNIRNDVRLFLEAKARLNPPQLRTEINKLYRLVTKVTVEKPASNDIAAQKLADAVDKAPADVQNWLARWRTRESTPREPSRSVRVTVHGRDGEALTRKRTAAGDPFYIPTADEIKSPETRRAAVQRLRLILSYGGHVEPEGRKRPTGKRSRSFKALLRAPGKAQPDAEREEKEETAQAEATEKKMPRKRGLKGRPRGEAERSFVRNLALTYMELTGKKTPHTANYNTEIRGPFSKFLHRCFELVGAPTGNITRLINKRGEARRETAADQRDKRQKRINSYCMHPDPPPVMGDPRKWG